MVEAFRYFCTSLLNWIGYAVPDYLNKVDIVDFGVVILCSFAISIFIHSFGGKINGKNS